MSRTRSLRNRRQLLLVVISVGLAIILLVLALRGIRWDEVRGAFIQADRSRLVFAFGVLTVSYFLRSLRWRVLLTADQAIHPITVFWATCAGYLGNNFLPARAGELLRSLFIQRRTSISVSYAFATAFTERIFDAVFLAALGALILSSMKAAPSWLQTTLGATGALGIGGLIILLLSPRYRFIWASILTRLPLPDRLRTRLENILDQFLQGLKALHSIKRSLRFVALTILIWSLDIMVAQLVGQAFGLQFVATHALLLLIALGLASALPSTPGYIGIYQFVAVTVLPPFGYTQDQSLVFIIAFQAVNYMVVIIWGLLGLSQYAEWRPFGGIRRAKSIEDERIG